MTGVDGSANPHLTSHEVERTTHERELLDCAKKYEEHEAWCPECRESAWKMCSDGMDLLQAVYMCLRSSKF